MTDDYDRTGCGAQFLVDVLCFVLVGAGLVLLKFCVAVLGR